MVGKRLAEEMEDKQRNHSRLPFDYTPPVDDKDGWICDAEGYMVGYVAPTELAEFIVQACNSYYAMKEALEEVCAVHWPYEGEHSDWDDVMDNIVKPALNSLLTEPASREDK